MQLIAILVICGFVVQDSLAEVETGALTAAFIDGGNSVAVPTIEGQSTENLRDIILNETALLINRIVYDLERQIKIQSHLEVTVLKLALETFNYEIEQMPVEATAESLDLALQSLNRKIVEAFNLIPTTLGGNAVIKPKKSSAKKDKPSTGSQKPPKVNTLFQLMNNLGQVLEKDLETVYKFQKKLLSAGYEGVETADSDFQEEFRTLAINDHIVPCLQSIVRDVQAKTEIVQAHVNAVTWTHFLALNDQLATVMANAGITETPEINETTESTESNEITETPDTNETTESNEITETTESNEITETTESNEITETTESNEITETPEINETTGATESAEITETTESAEINETTGASEINEITEGSDVTESGE